MIVENRKITVVGMGKTGVAVANFLSHRNARVTLIDKTHPKKIANIENEISPNIKTLFETSIPPNDSDYVVLSPGVDINSTDLEQINKRDIPVISEIELAFRFDQTPIIAITGTNGKTTTTTLIGQLLKSGGKRIGVGGNIGTPFITLVGKDNFDLLVLEVSSFQLEGIELFRPKIAAILNLSPDHLDRHKTFKRYVSLKGNISLNQTIEDFLILNADDPEVLKLGENRSVTKLFFSKNREVEQGAWIKNGIIHVRVFNKEFDICPVQSLPKIIQWQVENALAAAIAATLIQITPKIINQTFKNFSGLRHRLEWVRSHRGITFINDSKATNVGSVLKSLESIEGPLILIFGGQDKGSDFFTLVPFFKSKVKQLILIGDTREKIKKILTGVSSFAETESLEKAVRLATESAVPGDTVLLSPGCASFDMFKNYEDRGDQFKTIVHTIN